METAFKDTIIAFYNHTNENYLAKDEKQLIQEVLNDSNDNRAFSALVIKSQKAFAGYRKFRKVINETDAVSIFLESIWTGVRNFVEGKSSFTTFLYSHFYRSLINESVRLNRQINRANLNTSFFDIMEHNLSYEDRYVNLELTIKTDKEMSQFQKNIFWLLLQGYTLKEISKKLNIGVGKVYKTKKTLIKYIDYLQ